MDAVTSAEHPRAPPQLSGPPCPKKTSLCPTSWLLSKPFLLQEGMAEQPLQGGGVHWQQEPEAKPMLSRSRFQTGNHTDVPAGMLPMS